MDAESSTRRLPSQEPDDPGKDPVERREVIDGALRDAVALIQDALVHIQDAVTHIQNVVEGRDHKTPSEVEKAVRVDTNDSLAAIRAVSRVPGNNTYYEKGGLRTMGDGQDHIVEEPMTMRKFMIFVAMGFLWTGSQIPLYLFGGIIPNIEASIGGADRYVWIALAIFYWPPPRPNAGGLTRWQIAKRLDYVGGFLSAAGLTLFLAGLTWAGNQYTWNDNHVKVNIALGAVLIVLFFVWEIFFVPYPMFPARLKQNPRALYVVCFITFVSGASFFAVLVFWPTQYYATYTGDTPFPSPVTVGLGSLPVGFCIIGGSIIFSIAVTILKGKVRLLMVIACVIMTAGNGSMAAANLDNLPGVYAAVMFACLGVGAVIVPLQIISTIICPDDLIATVTALTISVRIVGGVIGYAAYYHILRTEFLKAIFVYLAPVVIGSGVLDPIEFGEIAINLSGNLRSTIPQFPAIDTPEKVAAVIHAGRQCFSTAYHGVYYVSIAFGGAAILAACFLPDITKLMDNHIAVQYRTERSATESGDS
ncbi:MAG: hypothetical protein Q9157_001730 [Trypethelium eluteriae]